MSALISSSIPESTNLSKRSETTSREDGDASGFDVLLKGGAERKTNGADEKGERGGEAFATSDNESGAIEETKGAEVVEFRTGRSKGGAGRLGFERSLLQARHEILQPSAENGEAGTEKAVGPMGEGVTLPQQAAAKAEAAVATAQGGPANAGLGAKATIEQLLSGYGSKAGTVGQAADLQAGTTLDGKATGANTAQLFPSSETAAAVSLAAGRVVRGGESAKGITARADLVSMRTDFQPVGMEANGAKSAAGSKAMAAQKLESALRAGTAPANARTGDAEASDDANDTLPITTGKDALPDTKQAKAHQHPVESARLSTDRPMKGDAGFAIEKSIDGDGDFGKQIGSIIADNMPQTGNRQGPAPQSAATAQATYEGASERVRYQAGGAAMKTLQIQLQPAHFGKLDVLMKVVNGQMALELSVSEPETLMRLQDDREGLKAAMASAGFDLDEAQVTITLKENGAQPGKASGSNADQNAQARADGNAPNGGEAGQSRGQDGQRGGRPSGAQMPQEQAGASSQGPALERGRRSGSDYYL
ncbi:flagellar hook-length control protein FliK [Fulvimarina sp. MAC8]|uniref:flagellar hook-length control protein FliK n=1 Tax=Fulvimarina sp. MAC8 TaxID=3162874 RepID=UPI0032ECF3BA